MFIGWLDSDRETWHQQKFVVGDGYFKPDGELQSRLYADLVEEAREKREASEATPNGKAKSCGNPKIYKWGGVRWYGIPYPVRIARWILLRHHPRPSHWHGCGCIVKLKAAGLIVRQGWIAWRAA